MATPIFTISEEDRLQGVRNFENTGSYARFNVANTNYSNITKDSFLINYGGCRFSINSSSVFFNAGGSTKLSIDGTLAKIDSNFLIL